jgi:S1/P1 Nuclease
VGDIHQPLHTTTNADRGGTCQQVNVVPAEENLHYVWDDAIVAVLERQLGTNDPEATARKLEAQYPSGSEVVTWKPGESEQIAWESHQLAETDVYQALGIPETQCELHSCDPGTRTAITLNQTYMHREAQVAGSQLAKAGQRLAALLSDLAVDNRCAPRMNPLPLR